MSTQVNLMVEGEVQEDLDQLIPAGQRSGFASEAIRSRLAQLKREMAVIRLDALRRKGPNVPTREVVRLLREVREVSR